MGLNKKSVDDINVKGLKVLCRCDFNVPLKDGKITDENRLVAALPTIKKLIADGGKVILCSHLGKVKTEEDYTTKTLAPVAARLSELLGQEVKFAADREVVGPNAKAAVEAMKDGDVILLENTRFRKEETKCGEEFSKDLASICDVFVNDAFGTAHRAHCSTAGVCQFVKHSAIGYLMEQELNYLGSVVNNPKRPLVSILGGAKVSSKISVISNLLEKVDKLIIGGGMMFTFIKALGDSCNVAMMEIAANLGTDNMIKYQSLFGFGSKTGIDLPSEERGILQDAEKMSVTDLATNSFGQNFDVTMIQMAAAYCSLINGGTYYQPHIVKSIENEKGEKIKSVTPTSVRQTVTADTSNIIKRILKEAVEQYGVTYVKVDGYSIGGKTGTAQKLPRSEKKWLISVAAFAPAENPQYVLYVVIDEPQGTTGTSGSGMDVQELTHDMLAELLPYLGVPKDTTATTENGNSESGSEGEGGIEVPEGTTLESTSSSDE